MAITTIARKVISWGLVTIPVTVHAATEHHRVPLHRVHADDGGRVRQRNVCDLDGRELRPDEIARGYELPDGRMLVLTDDDLSQLPTPDTKEIRVLGFIPRSQVEPIFWDRTYYLGASAPFSRPYALLREALLRSEQVAVARTALRTRDSLVLLGVRGRTMTMTTLLWPDEVRDPGGVAPEAAQEPSGAEIDLALQLMQAVSTGWEMEQERDEYSRALMDLVDAKAKGLPAPEAGRVLPPAAGDLMAALEASLARAREEHPEKAPAGKRAAKKAPAKKAAKRSPRKS
jgi:DNA end-binding protein Ku